MDGNSSVYLLTGFILVVLQLPFLLPFYLPHIVEVGLSLKTTSREAEHYFYNKEKAKRKTLLESVNCKKQIDKKGYFECTMHSVQSSSGAETSQHHTQYPSLQTVLDFHQSSLLNTRNNSHYTRLISHLKLFSTFSLQTGILIL